METTKKEKTMFCLACHQSFTDIYQHLKEFNDDKHRKFGENVERSGYEILCYCGGRIGTRSFMPESWETVCDTCGLQWDED